MIIGKILKCLLVQLNSCKGTYLGSFCKDQYTTKYKNLCHIINGSKTDFKLIVKLKYSFIQEI